MSGSDTPHDTIRISSLTASIKVFCKAIGIETPLIQAFVRGLEATHEGLAGDGPISFGAAHDVLLRVAQEENRKAALRAAQSIVVPNSPTPTPHTLDRDAAREF